MAPLETASQDRGPDTYAWRTAPAHLRTRRQLRAAGLAPGGHAPVAQTEHKRFGRRQVTYFYDVRLAVPKRTATPKQLAAVAKAVREHQARAAERHGIDRAELDRAHDPAPGWDHNPESDTHKEETTMSDTQKPAADPEVQQVQAETFDIQSQMQAREDAYERGDITWDEYQSWEFDYGPLDPDAASEPPAPEGHGQRIAFLLATVATNQARDRMDELDAAVERAEREGGDAIADLKDSMAAAVERAEARLAANTARSGAASVAPLADALVYRTGSAAAETRLAELTDSYAQDWGVLVDPEQLTVRLDPEFDALTQQTVAEAQALYDRESYAVDIVTALPMQDAAKAAATEAVLAWQDRFHTPGLHEYLDTQTERRQELGAALAAAKLTDSDRAAVEFAVDFLRGDVSEVDLLASPVWVDPGEETRSRIPELLDNFAQNPKAAPLVAQEIAVMTPADQDRVRAAGKDIAAGRQVEVDLWPGYVQRAAMEEDLQEYADDVKELRLDADELASGRMSQEERQRLGHKSATMHDETSARIDEIAREREQLLERARTGKGLAAIERAQIAAVVEDIDSGRILGRKELPELLFADERTKADVDFTRAVHTGAQLSRQTRDAITQRITATGVVEHDSRAAQNLTAAVNSVGTTLDNVACGSRAFGVEKNRALYAEKHAHLGQALTQAGIDQAARTEIRSLLDANARKAGELGAAVIARTEQWQAKTERISALRDDAAAQRQAADAGRASTAETAAQPGRAQQRACTGRTGPSRTATQAQAQAQALASAPTGIRQLHSPEQGIGR